MARFKIKKGYDIPLLGRSEKELENLPLGKQIALSPSDFDGMKLKLLVKAGDKVQVGTPLIASKSNEKLTFNSTAAGTVAEIVRGERRSLQAIVIETEGTDDAIDFGAWDAGKINGSSAEDLKEHLLKGGAWPFIRQRPYDNIANPEEAPKSIFINAMNTAPLAPKTGFVVSGRKADFQLGVDALTKLTSGKVFLARHEHCDAEELNDIKGVESHQFSGPHPAGLVSTHIYNVDPINKGDTVWYLNAQDVILLGQYLSTGKTPTDKIINVCGAHAKTKKYYKLNRFAKISDITSKAGIEDNSRIISGDILSGKARTAEQFLGYYANQVTVIKEGGEQFYLGEDKHWLGMGKNKFTLSRLFASKFTKRKLWNLDTNVHGDTRGIVLSDVYDKYVPLDIPVTYLVKSILVEDLDNMEKLGIYEVAPEDVALCEVACPAKLEVSEIVRKGLALAESEG